MGLENGITLVTRNKIDLDDWEIKPGYITVTLDEWSTKKYNRGYEYDVCYWRKCGEIRHDILEILHEERDDDGTYIIETAEQILQIRDALVHYLLKPEDWGNSISSIWSMDEYAPHLARDIMNLGWLANYMKEHEGEKLIVEFYDSY